MRLVVLLLIFISVTQAQSPVRSLKKTLSEAEKKYGQIYSYDDLFVSNHLVLETPLPHKIDDFLKILTQDYHFRVLKRENNIILSPKLQFQDNILCGYIKSQRFDRGIQNVLVEAGKQFTTTDSLGYFFFNYLPNKKGKLQFKTVQYGVKSIDYQITADCEDYYIDDDEIKLGEVILEYIVPPIEKRSNGSYGIDLTQLPTAPGSVNPDIIELIQLLPGVSNPNENSTIFIRGGTPDQNKINYNSDGGDDSDNDDNDDNDNDDDNYNDDDDRDDNDNDDNDDNDNDDDNYNDDDDDNYNDNSSTGNNNEGNSYDATATIWRGSTITFTRADGGNPTSETNQDRLTDKVWLTRGNGGKQIFNIVKNTEALKDSSPEGTEWAMGIIDQVANLTFRNFRDASQNKPKNVVGKEMVLHLMEDNVYLSVKFTSWSSGKKGGFSYERSTPN
ncbi:hypothetical protein N9X09_01925 [Flavobacteriaceae bacterium]|nr:hypothetical protein [Flavobacteriaceae bacterium]